MLPENLQYSEGTEMLERLGGSWQALLQITKHVCLTITWRLPNFSYLLGIKEHASQEIHYTTSTGLLGGVALRVVLLRTRFFIAPLPADPKAFPPLSFSSSCGGVAMGSGLECPVVWAVLGDRTLRAGRGASRHHGERGCSQGASSSPAAMGRNFPASLYGKRQICLKYVHTCLERQG